MELHRLGLEFGEYSKPKSRLLPLVYIARLSGMLTFELAFYLAGKDLVKTELQPSDDLVILATNALISAWDATRECLSA